MKVYVHGILYTEYEGYMASYIQNMKVYVHGILYTEYEGYMASYIQNMKVTWHLVQNMKVGFSCLLVFVPVCMPVYKIT